MPITERQARPTELQPYVDNQVTMSTLFAIGGVRHAADDENPRPMEPVSLDGLCQPELGADAGAKQTQCEPVVDRLCGLGQVVDRGIADDEAADARIAQVELSDGEGGYGARAGGGLPPPCGAPSVGVAWSSSFPRAIRT